MTRRQPYRCRTCDERFTTWAAAERHADTHGWARIDIELGS
jgi:hypothetical protein